MIETIAKLTNKNFIYDDRVRGRVTIVSPSQVTVEQAYESARLTGLSILADLQGALGDLDRIAAWGRVFGMVWCTPDFHAQPAVINGFSDLVLDVFGADVGAHARSAVGMSSLPFRIPVEIECEVVIRP